MKRIRQIYRIIEQALRSGVILSAGFIFLTLIGIPSDKSTQIAVITLPLFLLMTFYMGWRTGNRLHHARFDTLLLNLLALGVGANLLFVPFLGLIDGWHAEGVPVSQEYFVSMNTYPIHILSGVPNDELFVNPEPDALTNEYSEDTPLRTSPMQLYLEEKYALVSLFGLHIGGIYGLVLLIVLAAILGGITQNGTARVPWGQLRETAKSRLINPSLQRTLPAIGHWFILTLPLWIFILFWITIPQRTQPFSIFETLGLGSEDPIHLVNLDETFNLSSQTLINGISIQLGLAFLIIIAGILATRQARATYSALPYLLRLLPSVTMVTLFWFMARWRIEAHRAYFSAPTVFDISAETLTLGVTFFIAFIMLLVVLILNRHPDRFELTLSGIIAAGVILISPLYMDQYQTFIMGRVALAIMLGLGLNIVVGYSGLLNLGYVAFYAIGAYAFAFLAAESNQFKTSISHLNQIGWSLTTALIVPPLVIFLLLAIWRGITPALPPTLRTTTLNEKRKLLRKAPIWQDAPPTLIVLMFLGVTIALSFAVFILFNETGLYSVTLFSSFLVAMIIATLAGAFAGILLGLPLLRLRGDYLAIVTLGFGEIIGLALKNMDKTTGGPSGAIDIPKPVPAGISAQVSNLVFFYVGIIGSLLILFISLRLRNSRLGRAWMAVRSNEDIAQAMGINLVNVKLLAFAIGSGIAGLAGMLFASRQNSIFPDDFNLEVSINILSVVIIGGMGSLPGVVFGSIVLIGLPELLRPIQDYRIMAFGFLLVMTMVVRSTGLLPAPPPVLEERARRLAMEATPSAPDKAPME